MKKRDKLRKLETKNWEKNQWFGRTSFSSNSDTKIGPWFWFPIPKPGSGRTLGAMQNNKVVQKCHCDLSCLFRRNSVVLCVTLLSLVCGIKDMECKALVPRELHMHDLSN